MTQLGELAKLLDSIGARGGGRDGREIHSASRLRRRGEGPGPRGAGPGPPERVPPLTPEPSSRGSVRPRRPLVPRGQRGPRAAGLCSRQRPSLGSARRPRRTPGCLSGETLGFVRLLRGSLGRAGRAPAPAQGRDTVHSPERDGAGGRPGERGTRKQAAPEQQRYGGRRGDKGVPQQPWLGRGDQALPSGRHWQPSRPHAPLTAGAAAASPGAASGRSVGPRRLTPNAGPQLPLAAAAGRPSGAAALTARLLRGCARRGAGRAAAGL